MFQKLFIIVVTTKQYTAKMSLIILFWNSYLKIGGGGEGQNFAEILFLFSFLSYYKRLYLKMDENPKQKSVDC